MRFSRKMTRLFFLPATTTILLLMAGHGFAQRTYQMFWEERFAEREAPEIIEDEAPPLDPLSQGYLFRGDDGLLHPEAPFRPEDSGVERRETPDALLHFSRGVLALEAGQTARALREFERTIEADPDHIQARLKAADAALGLNDLSRSTLLFEEVLERDRDNVEAMLGLGRSLLMRDRAAEAREYMEAVLEIRPRNIAALTSLAQIAHEADRDYEKSLRHATEILHIDDRNIHGLLWGAEAHAHLGEMEESVALYRRLFRVRPALVERMIHFSSRLVSMNRGEDAALLYQEAVRAYPGHAMILRIWEDHLTLIGGPDRVRQGYRDLRESNPTDTQISELYARYLKRRGDWGALVELRQEILADDLSHIPSLMDMAEYHLERDEFELADPYFQAAISANPADGGTYRQVGRAYLEHGQPGEAVRLLEVALTYDSTDIDALSLMARAKESLGDMEAAVRHLRNALKESPVNANLLGKLGHVYLRKGDTDAAKALFQQVTTANPLDLDSWLILAKLYLDDGDEAGLTTLEEQARRQLRGRADFDFAYGILALEHGEFERARGALERALRELPENLDVRHSLARACLHLNLDDLAFRIVGEGEDYVGEDEALRIRHQLAVADIHTAASDHEKAGSIYKELVEDFPDELELRELLLFSLIRQARDDEAMEVLNTVVSDFNADQPRETQLLRARYLVRTGQYDRALGRLRTLASEYPADNDISVQLAIAAGGSGDVKTAEKIYRDLIELGNADVNPWYEIATNNLGYLFAEKEKRLDEAEELVARALAVNPNAAYILDSMGWILFQKGEFEEARVYLERAAHLSLGDGEILFHLGQLYEQLGMFDQARQQYDRALRADPRLHEAREKRDALARSRGEASTTY